MSSRMKIIKSIDRVITAINGGLLVVALIAMSVLVFFNVIGRYFFSYSVIWVDELARYLMIISAFLGMGLAMRQSSHTSFTIFQDILPNKARKALRIIVLVFSNLIMLGLAYLGWLYAKDSINLSEAHRWPVKYWYMSIPIGSLLFVWHTTMFAAEYINQEKDADLAAEIEGGDILLQDSEILKELESDIGSEILNEEDDK